jgi:hypothetical protein
LQPCEIRTRLKNPLPYDVRLGQYQLSTIEECLSGFDAGYFNFKVDTALHMAQPFAHEHERLSIYYLGLERAARHERPGFLDRVR